MATSTMTTTTDTSAMLRLMSWLSPVFPTGGFAYSAGLEQAVADGLVTETATLSDWIATQITHGSLWNDAVFLVAAHRHAVAGEPVTDLVELATAMQTASERLAETCDQGTSFVLAAQNWFETDALPPRGTPLPICVGFAAGLAGIDPKASASAYLHAFATNQLQCAIRLSVTGQNGAAKALATLEPVIAETAHRAADSSLDDLGTCAFMADITAMNHETLQPRLFRS